MNVIVSYKHIKCQTAACHLTVKVFRALECMTVTNSAYQAIADYINATSEHALPVAAARTYAEEFGINAPEEPTCQLLASLAAAQQGDAGAVAITPAAGLVGLYVLPVLPGRAQLTCIDPESEHQAHAKALFREAGFAPSAARFLPSRPLDVLGRLATGSYHLIFADVASLDLSALIDLAFPLLTVGGTLVLNDSLLDGTLADGTRRDRETVAAREADDKARSLEGAVVTRLPLGAGLTLLTKTA